MIGERTGGCGVVSLSGEKFGSSMEDDDGEAGRLRSVPSHQHHPSLARYCDYIMQSGLADWSLGRARSFSSQPPP